MSGSRIRRGIGANVLSIATRIIVQFATLPLFFAAWPAERVGAWLLIFALPAYVAIFGTGFAGAGGSESLAAARSGDMRTARARFRAAWWVATVGTAVFAIVFFLAGAQSARLLALDAASLAPAEIVPALGWLSLYILASSQIAIAEIPYRVAERYPDHILLSSIANLVEVVIIAASLFLTDSLSALAMFLALGRCAMAAAIMLQARRVGPTLFGSGGSARREVRGLLAPSLAFMAMPVIFGLNLQGYLLIVGARYGPALLAAFAATRTLTRLLDLVTNFAYGLHYFESGYLSGDTRILQRRILATMTTLALTASILFAVVLLIIGPWLQDLYTAGKTAFDPAVAGVLLAAATLRALSASPLAIIAARNRHAPTIAIYLTGSLIAVACAALLSASGASLPVTLALLIVAEACQLVPALRAALRELDLTFSAFFAALLSRDRLRDITDLAQRLRGMR